MCLSSQNRLASMIGDRNETSNEHIQALAFKLAEVESVLSEEYRQAKCYFGNTGVNNVQDDDDLDCELKALELLERLVTQELEQVQNDDMLGALPMTVLGKHDRSPESPHSKVTPKSRLLVALSVALLAFNQVSPRKSTEAHNANKSLIPESAPSISVSSNLSSSLESEMMQLELDNSIGDCEKSCMSSANSTSGVTLPNTTDAATGIETRTTALSPRNGEKIEGLSAEMFDALLGPYRFVKAPSI